MMSWQPMQTRKNSLRHKQWDYSQPGGYVVTICTHNRLNVFGDITDNQMGLNSLGQLVSKAWQALPNDYPTLTLDAHIVMPNHLHGIIVINDLTSGATDELSKHSLCCISTCISRFKMQTAKQINICHNAPGKPLWQRGYYDHIIRNEADLARCREYIINNPAQWILDKHYTPN